MILTIITINRNNAAGLEKTMRSVATQTCKDYDYVVVDGASTDNSVEVIKGLEGCFGEKLKWISEPDKGIYNAMNKGIEMASGEYLEFLNSGDILASNYVVELICNKLKEFGYPSILYGNMLKDLSNGRIVRDRCFAGEQVTLLGMYRGCLNHSPAFIRKSLFEKYNLYNENLHICSDWEWYTKAIVLGEETPSYTDIDVTLFDMTGISETNKELLERERRSLLQEMVPRGILTDYDNWFQDIKLMERIKRYSWIYSIIKFIERVLFKFEKAHKEYIKK